MGVIIAVVFIVFCSLFARGQEHTADNKIKDLEEKRPATISLLSNYYGQDGEHGAVNGGIGSQFLESYSQEAAIYIPIRDSSAFKVHAGVDHFTSASLRMIDKYKTEASTAQGNVSKDETRKYGNISFDLADKKHNSIHTPTLGFSTEYDVSSVNMGYSWTKFFPEKNMSYQVGGTLVVDRWLMIYPGEFRTQVMGYQYVGTNTTGSGGTSGSGGTTTGSGTTSGGNSGGTSGSGQKMTSSGGSGSTTGASTTTGSEGGNSGYTTGASTDTASWKEVPVGYAKPIAVTGETATKGGKTYPVDWRYSWAITNTVTYVINQRMNGAIGLDIMGQTGLLSTPFYRVYFDDGVSTELDKQVYIEKLPRQRLKAALYTRYNYQFADNVSLRLGARYYQDTWDISALTASVEVPVKLTGSLSIDPFYRIHLQQGSKYFAAYGKHVYSTDGYYTSDYDLAGFTAHKIGATLRLSPLKPLFSLYNKSASSIFSMPSVGIRYAYYMRSDGLKASSVSLEMNFNL